MFRSDSIHPVTDFVRNHKRHHESLRASGRPELLTINGLPELVVQDVRAFERAAEETARLLEENFALRERLEELETLMALDEAYEAMQQGRSRTLAEALPDLRRQLRPDGEED